MDTPPFDASPEAREAVARTLRKVFATAGRYCLDLAPYLHDDASELEPRAQLIQLRYALRNLFTWDDTSHPATAPADVEAIYNAVEAASRLRTDPTLPDLLAALRRYDEALAAAVDREPFPDQAALSQLPMWTIIGDETDGIWETLDSRGVAWRFWAVWGDVPRQPPLEWRYAPVDALDQFEALEHIGGGKELDLASMRIDVHAAIGDRRFRDSMGLDYPTEREQP